VRIADGITLRIGKYGPYLEIPPAEGSPADAPPRRINVPEDLAPDELTEAKARELIDAPIVGDRELGINPANGKTVVAKDGRYGPYVTELEPVVEEPEADAVSERTELAPIDPENVDALKVDSATGEIVDVSAALLAPKKKAKPKKKKVDAPKPRTASLFKSMDPATVDLETALMLLDLPRVVGQDPESGEDITAQNGRYGPYIKKGTDSRSLETEEQIFSIDLPGALEVFAQPKYGARRPSSALKEFDADPESGKPIRVRDGRFGPYVTDGVTNATIPRGEEVEAIDFERAVQLLADKRAKGPVKPKSRARSNRAPAKRA
jgi:DNA topoisomerase-1